MVEAFNPNDQSFQESAPYGGGSFLADPIRPVTGRVLQFPDLLSRPAIKSGADVERTNQFEFYELGKALHPLNTYVGSVTPLTIFWDLWAVGRSLHDLINNHTPTPLGVSKTRAIALYDCIDTLMRRHCSEQDEKGEPRITIPKDDAAPLGSWEIEDLQRAVAAFETVFGDEMREAATYRVPARGIYSIPKLVDSADESFPEEVRDFIPVKARLEWCAAGRCLAFNLLSASGFHVARAVEGMLEVYYKECCSKDDEKKTWGDYVAALKKTREADETCVSQKVIDELEQMKDDYRNPIMHPRVVLSETDARMLFDNGESLIMVMAQELAKKSKPETGSLFSEAVAAAFAGKKPKNTGKGAA